MERTFNIAGPCIAREHYMLPPERRLRRVMKLIEQRKYFTLHAGRQTGKTTSVNWMVRHYNAGDRYRAVGMDIQTAREQPDPAIAFRTVLGAFESGLQRFLPDLPRPSDADVERFLLDPSRAVLKYLRALCAACPLPLLVFIDEADGLVGATMVSFLTQLREGYLSRDDVPFPSSVVLIGQRQVRDFALSEEDRRAVSWLGTTSPFNVTAEATTLESFTESDVAELLAQHTAATGQVFLPEAVSRIWELGAGHPWLTNSMADQITTWDVEDRAVPITAAHVDAAKETIILDRRSHIDSLIARLRDDRVRRVLDPMLAGMAPPADLMDEDVQYVLGLGIIARRGGALVIANPIYREVIPRTLTWVQQLGIHQQSAWYQRPDGSLDMGRLLVAFQDFWRKDGHLAARGFQYAESGPHLMLMAFLQRVVNGGGRIEREYGLGRGALDLMVFWRGQRHAIELKLRRDTETETDGIEQLFRYLDLSGLAEGWLVMFDLRSTAPWSERLFVREHVVDGRTIHLIGC